MIEDGRVRGSQLRAPLRSTSWSEETVITPQPWSRDGLCQEVDPELFFPEKGSSVSAAKSLCRQCPVSADCLLYALSTNQAHGVWGGMTAKERARMRRGETVAPSVRGLDLALHPLAGQVAELRGEGLPDVEIAVRLGVRSDFVGRVRKALGLSVAPRRRRGVGA